MKKAACKNRMIIKTLLIVILFALSQGVFGTIVQAATSATDVLEPGASYDTGNHSYDTNDLQEHDNTSFVSKGSGANAGWQSSTGSLMNMQNGQTGYSASWAVFNGALDMTNPVSFSGSIKVVAGSGYNPAHAGDSFGVIFTPLSASQLSNGGVGAQLGLGGLPNSVFAGRDFYYNSAVQDNPLGRISYSFNYPLSIDTNASNQIRIATTNEAGTLNPSGSAATGANPISSVPVNNQAGDSLSINWQPITVGEQSTTGNLSLTVDGVQITYTNLTMQNSMSFGLVSSTGGAYSVMTANFNGAFTAEKGSSPTIVSYINAATQAPMEGMPSSVITTSVGDLLGVIAPNTEPNAADTYDYTAPEPPAGYKIQEISPPIRVENVFTGTDNPNNIIVTYAPVEQSGQVTYSYVSDTPGYLNNPGIADPNVPHTDVFSGETDTDIILPEWQIPAGYRIASVTGPDGQTYASLEEALNAHPTFTVSNNDFQVLLAATEQTAVFTFAYESENGNSEIPDPVSQAGLTGSVIADPTSSITDVIPEGYDILKVVRPNGSSYDSIEEALKASPYYLTTGNDFQVILKKITHSVVTDQTITRTIHYLDANDAQIVLSEPVIQKVVFHSTAIVDAFDTILGYDLDDDGEVDTTDVDSSWVADQTTGDTFAEISSPAITGYGTPNPTIVQAVKISADAQNSEVEVRYSYMGIELPHTGGRGKSGIYMIAVLALAGFALLRYGFKERSKKSKK